MTMCRLDLRLPCRKLLIMRAHHAAGACNASETKYSAAALQPQVSIKVSGASDGGLSAEYSVDASVTDSGAWKAFLQPTPVRAACSAPKLGRGGHATCCLLSWPAAAVTCARAHPGVQAGGDYTITASCTGGCDNTTAAVLEGITFGDVWYCAGQSNSTAPAASFAARRRTFAPW